MATTQQRESPNGVCDRCYKRPGKVVMDEMVGPFPLAGVEAFRFVYRRCRWCEAVETRRRNRFEAALAKAAAPTPGDGRDE